MKIRLAKRDDLAQIKDIYAYARGFMAQTGSPYQWINGYPKEELLKGDIVKGNLYVLEDEKSCSRRVCFFSW